MTDDEKEISLKTQDGNVLKVPKKVIALSKMVKELIDEGDDEEEQEVPIMEVEHNILVKVIEFCKHYLDDNMAEIEKPLKSKEMSAVVSEWYAQYIDIDQQTLFAVILAANYMEIQPLLDLSCAKVATMIKGKSPEEIRQTFNIVNDFTPEEEKQIREENKWCDEV